MAIDGFNLSRRSHRTEVRSQIPKWYEKRPQLVNEAYNENGEPLKVKRVLIHMNGKPYEITRIGEGKYHLVFRFVHAPHQVLKYLKNDPHIKPQEWLSKDIKEMAITKEHNIETPLCYIRPDLYDPENEDKHLNKFYNGGFFVMEYIPIEIDPSQWTHKKRKMWTENEKRIFDFVVKVLSINARSMENNKDLVFPDFYPRNVRCREDGTPVLIDFTSEPPDFEDPIDSMLKAWSGNSQKVYDYLYERIYSSEAKRQRS